MGTAGLVTSLLLATHNSLWGSTPPPTMKVTSDGSFLSPWDDYDAEPPCAFYNGTYVYTAALCSHFALARMSATTQTEAISRAMTCAVHHKTDCVLSPEVGLSVPAAFVYDVEDGLKMVIAPKVVDMPPDQNATQRHVAFQHPTTPDVMVRLRLYDAVNVEFMQGGARRMTTQVYRGAGAFCVQMLRLAFDEACWAEID